MAVEVWRKREAILKGGEVSFACEKRKAGLLKSPLASTRGIRLLILLSSGERLADPLEHPNTIERCDQESQDLVA
jgi:hypothetical protein